MAILRVVRGPTTGQRFRLVGDCSVIGRHPNCDVVLEVGAISRRHAQILFVDGEYFVEDLRSRNGTFVNDDVITGCHKLNDSDEVKICDVVFTFHETSPAAEGSPDSTWAMMSDNYASNSTSMSPIEFDSGDISNVGACAAPESKLKAQLEITNNLANTLSLDQVLPRVLESLFEVFVQADRGFIVLREDAGANARAPLARQVIETLRDEGELSSRELVLRACDRLSHNHLYVPDVPELDAQLREKAGDAFRILTDRFHRLVVLDAACGVDPRGNFRLTQFQQHILAAMDDAFELRLDRRRFHPEQITQIAKDEPASLFCFLNVHYLSQADLQSLIHFTQQQHRVLFCGSNPYLASKALSSYGHFVSAPSGATGPLVPKAVKYRRDDDGDTVRISTTVVRQVMSSKQAILSADAATDPKFAMSENIADFRIRSLMCAPLVASDGWPLGVIQIDTLDQRRRFQEDDLDVMAAMTSQAALAIEKSALHEQALQQQTLKCDLTLAYKLQQGNLPQRRPNLAGYRFFDFYEPAIQIGSDLFDYVLLPNNRLAVIVADVSGKGVSAALLMAQLKSEACYHLAAEPSPARAVSRLCKGILRKGWENLFVTFMVAVVGHKTHEVTLVNAGHLTPLLRHPDSRVEEVGAEFTGFPLGVDGDWQYQEYQFQLEPGATLVAFTDGFIDAENSNHDMYGMEELKEQVAGPASSVQDLGQRIVTDVTRFTGQHRQSDDMGLVCFGRSVE